MRDFPASGLRLRGRHFTFEELAWVRDLVAGSRGEWRSALSRRVCEHLGWVQPNGRLKDQGCRSVLLQLHRAGYLTLPPPRFPRAPRRPLVWTERTAPRLPFDLAPSEVRSEHFRVLHRSEGLGQQALWNEYVDRYHYLGHRLVVGPRIRYFVEVRDQPVACLAFGGAAWKVEPRDLWIGWTHQEREKFLFYIINNVRFLILPWFRVKNLASRILSLAARRVPDDWEQRYGYRPVLMETFVQADRHVGTCYKAANWILVGQTKGRGKMDRENRPRLPKKLVYVYPLMPDFRVRVAASVQGKRTPSLPTP